MSESWLARLRAALGQHATAASVPQPGESEAYRALCDSIETLTRTFAERALSDLRAQLATLSKDFGLATVVDLIARQDRARPSIAFARCLSELLPDDVAEPYLERLVAEESLRSDAQLRLAKLQLARGDRVRAAELLQSVIADDIDHAEARRLLASLQTLGPVTVAGATLFGAANVALSERYALKSELGRGSEGVVYLADDQRLARQVAIKIFHTHAHMPQSHELQFFRRLHQLPRDPIFVRILDLDPRDRFFVMEFCSGGSLADLLAKETPSAKQLLEIAIALCKAVALLDAAELVHGDLKPTNILFRTPRRAIEDIVLSDFGRVHNPDEVAQLAGTLVYMSPAALRSENAAGQDLFALGIILLEALGVPDLPTLRRQLLADENPAPALFSAIPPARIAAFGVQEPKLRALVYAMLAERREPGQILAQMIALQKELE